MCDKDFFFQICFAREEIWREVKNLQKVVDLTLTDIIRQERRWKQEGTTKHQLQED